MKMLVKLFIKMDIMLTLIYLIVEVVSIVFFRYLFPQDYFALYPAIGIFYWIFGIALNGFLQHYRTTYPEKLLNAFMLCRAVKFMFTIVFLIIGVHLLGGHKDAFVISLMLNYFMYTALELYIYYLHNKRMTKKETDK